MINYLKEIYKIVMTVSSNFQKNLEKILQQVWEKIMNLADNLEGLRKESKNF